MTELGPAGHSCSQRDGIHVIESELIGHRRARQMDEVSLLVELAGDDLLTSRQEADLRPAPGVRRGCRVVDRGTLPHSEVKSKRIRRIEE